MIVLNDHETVDCVVATLQHGYDKPIVIDPLPDDTQAQPEPPKFPSAAKQSVQDYGTITERCPSDTIARKHFDLDDLTQFSTLDEFLDVVGGRDRRYAPMVTGYREYASAAQAYSGTAASTVLSINKPTDEHSEEMSISQLWLVSQLNQPDQETIEVGWQVARSRHSGVRDPYLFVFWSTLQYTGPGCYDQVCGGFNAQPGAGYIPGVSLTPASTVGGTQYYVDISAYRASGKWYIKVGGQVIGWYDISLFHTPGLYNNFQQYTVGGEVAPGIDYPSGVPPFRHSKIDMGSGQAAGGGWLNAAFHTAVQKGVVTNSNPLVIVWTWANLSNWNTMFPGCYDLVFADPPSNTAFYFGGTGYSLPNCP
jgi:hypothetical protein